MGLYEPISGVKGFSLNSRVSGQELTYKDRRGSIKTIIRPGGHVPKTGLYLCDNIGKFLDNKTVLDLGTGETAIIALFAALKGAKNVIGSDIKNQVVTLARENVIHNKMINNVEIRLSDLFTHIHESFDVIISNPPQMPMLHKAIHDSGGVNGREIIERIIHDSPSHLNPGGKLIMLLFDFLGVEDNFNNEPSIFEVMNTHGLQPSLVAKQKRFPSESGQTYKSFAHIKQLFPKYKFQMDKSGRPFHYIFVVKGELHKKTI